MLSKQITYLIALGLACFSKLIFRTSRQTKITISLLIMSLAGKQNALFAEAVIGSLAPEQLGAPIKKKSEGENGRKKCSNKPRNALSAYAFFANEKRREVMKKYPKERLIEITVRLGGLWMGMSEKEKEKYEDMAKEDKVRYAREMAAYNNK